MPIGLNLELMLGSTDPSKEPPQKISAEDIPELDIPYLIKTPVSQNPETPPTHFVAPKNVEYMHHKHLTKPSWKENSKLDPKDVQELDAYYH